MSAHKQQMEQILALVGLYLHSGKTEAALRLLEQAKPAFVQEQKESNWTLTYAQALIAHGTPEKALEMAASEKEPRVARDIRTMALHEISQRSGAWQPFVDHLEACFAETQDGELLFELCQVKARLQEWAYVADHAETLIQFIGTADAVRLAASAAWHADRPQQCLRLLSENSGLFPEGVLPVDLRRLRVHCQVRLGDLSQAVADAEELLRQDDTTENVLTLMDIQMRKGDLPGVALTARRLISREDLSSRHLLRIARLVLFDAPELAKQCWHRARARQDVLQDPALLNEAISLGFTLGLDPEMVPFLARMQEFAAQGEGSFQLFDLKDLPSMAKNRTAYLDHIQQKYDSGEGPIHFAAEKLNVSLAHVFHGLLEHHRQAPAPQYQPVIWARHGGRQLPERLLDSNGSWRLHMDITALLLAADVGILDKVEQCFAPLRIPAELPTALVRQRDMLAPQQPFHLAGYRRLLQLFQDGKVQPIPQATDASAGLVELINKRGAGWIALLENAKTESGFIVDYLPLTSNSLEAEPITLPDQYRRHVINCRALVQSLRDHGYFSEPAYQQALHDLGSVGTVDVASVVPEIGARLFLVSNIASVLADANLLELVCRHFQVFVEPLCLDEARHTLQGDERREELVAWLEQLIDYVREGLEREVYEWISLPDDASRQELEKEETANPDSLSLIALLHFRPQEGDIIWVDDRWANSHAHRDGVPIIGVNEILRALLQREALQEVEYYTILRKLRAANVRYIPLEVEEVLYHLQQAQVIDGAVVETAELSILRRYIAACLLDDTCLQRPPMPPGAPNPEGETAFLLGTIRVTTEAMIACWSDENGYGDRAGPYADWILENLYTGVFGIRHLRADPDPESDGLDLIGRDIGNALVRSFSLRGNLDATDESISPRRKFFDWLDSRVLAWRLKADPGAVTAVADTLKKVIEDLAARRYDDPQQDIFSRILLQRYFLELPKSIQAALQLDPEVMAWLGVQTFNSVNVGALCFERTEFYEAVTRTLQGQEEQVHERISDIRYTLVATHDGQTGRPVIEIKDQRGAVVATYSDPMMGLLLDEQKVRQEWLQSHRTWFDCNHDEFPRIAAEIASAERPLERLEKTRVWWEASAAVFYTTLEQRLKNIGQFSSDDLLPPSATSLLRYLRLASLTDNDADFQDCLHKAARTLIAEEGLETAINRIGGLPVRLPAIFVEECDRLSDSERQQFFNKLALQWTAPVCKLHLLDLVLRYSRDEPFCLNLACSLVGSLFDETTGAQQYRLYNAVLNFVNDEFSYWAETTAWPASAKLAIIWAHASRLHNIFMAVHSRPEQLAQWLEKVQHHTISTEIFGREPAFSDDILHPVRINRTIFLIHGIAAILAGHDSEMIGQLGIKDVLLNTGFPEANGSRSPHIALLRDPELARNILGSFFGGNRAVVLAPCLGNDPANTLASSCLHDIVQQAIQQLKLDPCQQPEWAKIGMIVGDLPMYDDLRTGFRDLLASLDFEMLNAVDPITASLALHIAADHIIHFADEELGSRCQAGLLEIARFQTHRNRHSTNNGAADESQSVVTSFLFESAFKLSLKSGEPRNTSETFAKLVQEMFNTWPPLAQTFRRGLSRLVKKLPARQLHGLWRLVLQSRTYDDYA